MSASSPRRLPFVLLVVGLSFPSFASAAPWEFGGLRANADALFSRLWTSVGWMEHSGICGSGLHRLLKGYGLAGSDASCAAATEEGDSAKPAFDRTGCVILPDGRCGA